MAIQTSYHSMRSSVYRCYNTSKVRCSKFVATTKSKHLLVLILFNIAHIAQPLLIDAIKLQGGAHASTFLYLLPHYLAMALVGFLPAEKKLSECNWNKASIVSSLDIINQLLKKAGLVYAGAAVYIIIDSFSLVWTAIWTFIINGRKLSLLQWLSLILITFGISLKAMTLNFNWNDHEFFGASLISIATVLMGLTFVLTESFMKPKKPNDDVIPGPKLVCMMGILCSVCLTIWTLFWTIPRFDELVLNNIEQSGGNPRLVLFFFFLLLIAGWIHSATLWFLMTELGAVSSGVLKGIKVAAVFTLSHYFFCDFQKNQCLNVATSTSAIVCILGVVMYTISTNRIIKQQTAEIARNKDYPIHSEASIEDLNRIIEEERDAMLTTEASVIFCPSNLNYSKNHSDSISVRRSNNSTISAELSKHSNFSIDQQCETRSQNKLSNNIDNSRVA